MTQIARRSFLKTGLAGAAGAPGLVRHLYAAEPGHGAGRRDSLAGFGMECIGRVRPIPSAKIQASPLSVGFETLDRKHFDPKRTFPHLAKLGVKWARCQTGWCRCETRRGAFDFRWLDEVVDGLLKIGVQPWFNLGYGNRLYTPQADDEAAVG
jgi:polysaccharide biosynthesis protein PslG